MLFSPTVRDSGFWSNVRSITGLAGTSSEGRIANRPGRSDNGLKEIMQQQQADCLERQGPGSSCPVAGFSRWQIEIGGNRVAAVAFAGAGRSRREAAAAITDTGFMAVSAPGSALPVLWMPETAWQPAFQRWKARNDGNGHRGKRGGRFVNESKLYA
jgi:hypothetical protein